MANRTNVENENVAIRVFLALLDKSIQAGVNIQQFPKDLALFMLMKARPGPAVDLNEEFEGDVNL